MLLSGWEQTGGESIAIWSFWGRHAGHNKHPTPVFINLDNVLTLERQDDLTTVVVRGGNPRAVCATPEKCPLVQSSE